jgi:hypothetical protein
MQSLTSTRGGRFVAAQRSSAFMQQQHAARRVVRVAAAKKQLMMWEALREATDEEMERDPTVCVMGERAGGVHGQAGGREAAGKVPAVWSPGPRCAGHLSTSCSD